MDIQTKNYRSIRNLLVKIYHSFPRIYSQIGLPDSFYSSVKQWMINCSENKETFFKYEEIYPTQEMERLKPKTLENAIHPNFQFSNVSYKYQTASVGVSSIKSSKGIRIWGANATVITPDNRLVADTPGEFYVNPANPKNHPIFLQWKLPSLVHLEGKIASLATPGSHNYFHWMLNTLPRLHLLQKSSLSLDEIDYFLVSQNCNSRFHRETLDILGIPTSKVIQASWQFHIQVNHLILPSVIGLSASPLSNAEKIYQTFGNLSDNVPYWACNFLRETLLNTSQLEGEKTKESKKRIYVTRKKSVRYVINEPEIIELLTKYGFEIIDFSELSVVMQAKILSNAEVIVAPHGAGLTNLIFCSQGTKVIEIFSPHYLNLTYWGLSNLMKLDYYYIISESSVAGFNLSIDECREDNLLIPLHKLLNTLKMADIVG